MPKHPTRVGRFSDEPLGKDVARAFRKRGILKEAQAAWITYVANEVGKGRFRPTAFRDGELVCTAGSLPVAELQLLSEDYLLAINKKLGREIVQRIRFKQ